MTTEEFWGTTVAEAQDGVTGEIESLSLLLICGVR